MSTPAGIPVATCDLNADESLALIRGRRFQRGPLTPCKTFPSRFPPGASIVRSVTDASAAARRALSPYGTEHGSPTGVI